MKDAFKWYEERSFFAADNFILSVENAISAICANPCRYRNTYKNLREITIKSILSTSFILLMKIKNQLRFYHFFIIEEIQKINTKKFPGRENNSYLN